MRTRRPSPPLRSRSCQVTSQPLERCTAGSTPPAAMQDPAHAHVRSGRTRSRHARGSDACLPRAQAEQMGTLRVPPVGLGSSRGALCQAWGRASLSVGMAVAWGGVSPSGPQGTLPSSPARWPPRCCQHLRTPLRPAGTPAPLLSQPLQEPGVPISAPPCQGGVPSCGCMPRTARGGGGWWGVAGQDQAPPSLPRHWGGEGARMLLCSWAGSVSSRRKSFFVAGPVI